MLTQRPERPKRQGSRARKGEQKQPETPKASEFYSTVHRDGDLLTVALTDIELNPFNDREMVGLDALAEDIESNGLINPVTLLETEKFVRSYPEFAGKLTKKWTLGPGEHRFRAMQMVEGATTIDGIVRNDKIETIQVYLLAENLKRTNPSPIEVARQLKAMQESAKASIRVLAREMEDSPTNIHRTLALLNLPRELQDAVHQKDLLVSHAYKILDLKTEDFMLAAWRLMQEEPDLSVVEAIRQVRSGETPSTKATPARIPDASKSGGGGSSDKTDRVPPARPAPDDDSGPGRRGKGEPSRTASKSATEAEGQVAAQRQIAQANREAACIALLTTEEPPQASVIARAMLASGQNHEAARVKAQTWLRKIGKHVFDVPDPSAYHQAVLASNNAELIQRAVFATALAACETRASDRRRKRWDIQDVEHVRVLIEHVAYTPTTEWERNELARFEVSVPETAPQP